MNNNSLTTSNISASISPNLSSMPASSAILNMGIREIQEKVGMLTPTPLTYIDETWSKVTS